MSVATEPRKGQSKFVVTDVHRNGTENPAFESDTESSYNNYSPQFNSSEYQGDNVNLDVKSRSRRDSKTDGRIAPFLPGIGLLLWKNTLLRRRHFVITALEIILPTLFACLIAFFKTWTPPTPPHETNIVYTANQFFEKDLVKEISRWNNRRRTGTYILGYAPANNFTDHIMYTFTESLKKYKVPLKHETRRFETEAAIKKFNSLQGISLGDSMDGVPQKPEILTAAIVFEEGFDRNYLSLQDQPSNFGYKIRMVDRDYKTDATYASVKFPGPDTKNAGKGYQEGGFASIQIFLDKAIISVVTNQTLNYTLSVQGFPYPPYKAELDFSRIFINVLPQFLVFGFIFIVPSILRNVVAEKESGIKELMKMMGLRSYLHWIGWMLDSVLILVIPVSIVIAVLFVEFNAETGPFLVHSDPSLWFVTVFLYVVSAVSSLFCLSTLFQKATMAISVGTVLWIVLYFAIMFPLEQNYNWLTLTQKMASCLIPNVALHWSVKLMYSFEAKGIGAKWSNMGQPLNTLDDFTLAQVLAMLLISICVYTCLTLYLECICPSRYGITKPWYFIFKASFWKNKSKESGQFHMKSMINGNYEMPQGFETEPSNSFARVKIQNLRKAYGKKENRKVAVDGLNLNMYDGHITVLLGCNGAGKTTLISMLTGLFSPTDGSATISGFDIKKDMDSIRTQLGYCPQYNIIFEMLTVRENLQFFGRLKGGKSDAINKEIKDLLPKLQLSEKKNALAVTLSGGQKRKLCLGMSIVGGSKVVILDEPTAGMDPEARRGIWDLLLETKTTRTMLLTTHFMEEADILGDRVAIMASGKVHCCGSPLFLKRHYGSGYTLKMSIHAPPKSDCDAIFDIVKNYSPGACWLDKVTELNQNEVCDISIVLPRQNGINDTSRFPELFTELTSNKKKLGIIDIGLPLTTLDDVFAKVVDETTPNGQHSQRIATMDSSDEATLGIEQGNQNLEHRKVTGYQLAILHLYGLLVKRIIYTKRKKVLFAVQLILPLLLVIAAVLVFNKQNAPLPPSPALRIDLSPYKNPKTLYAVSNETQELGSIYNSLIANAPEQISAQVRKIPDDTDLDSFLLAIGKDDENQYRERYVTAADFTSKDHVRAMFQTLPFHGSPLAINLVSNSLLRYLSKDDQKASTLTVTNHPMKSGLNSLLEACTPNPRASSNLPLIFALLIPLGLSTLAASFIVFPLEERICQAKQLQIMTGISTFTFWISSFLWDLFLVILLAAAMVAFFPILQDDYAFTTANAAPAFFLIIVVYGICAISFSYLLSLFMSTVSGGFAFITVIHIVTGTLWCIVVHALEQSNFFDIADSFRWFGRLFPTFGASISLIRFVDKVGKNVRCNMVTPEVKNIVCNPNITSFDPKVFVEEFQACCDNCEDFAEKGVTCFKQNDYLAWTSSGESEHIPANVELPGIGQELLALIVMAFLYQLLLFVFELLKSRKKIGRPGSKAIFPRRGNDADVSEENSRVERLLQRGESKKDAIVVENLSKRFGSYGAVSNLTFGVHQGECFGLLGVNGAGKTTLFQMMTGNLDPSAGNAHINSYSLRSNLKYYVKSIGYCPQYDGVIGCLTGKEMLELFCRLRGIHPRYVKEEAKRWLNQLGLQESADVPCQNYSGGMKRRLSAAISMIGNPPVIMLDEPTSGVDPVSRRQFWSLVTAGKNNGQALILTSHSMEECEALCSRLAIMVSGGLQCIGTVQHLKSKFSQGFTVTLKINQQLSNIEREGKVKPLCEEISNAFSPCEIREQHENVIEYQVTNEGIDWGDVFGILEELKKKYDGLLEDYSVNETTLEEIFLNIAKTGQQDRRVQVPCIEKLLTCQTCL